MALDAAVASASIAIELCRTNLTSATAALTNASASSTITGLPMFADFCKGAVRSQNCYYSAQYGNVIPQTYNITVATVVVNVTNYPNTTVTHTATITKEAALLSAEIASLKPVAVPAATTSPMVGTTVLLNGTAIIAGSATPSPTFNGGVRARDEMIVLPTNAAQITGFNVVATEQCDDGRSQVVNCLVSPRATASYYQLDSQGASLIQSAFNSLAPPLAACSGSALGVAPTTVLKSLTTTVTKSYFSMGYPTLSGTNSTGGPRLASPTGSSDNAVTSAAQTDSSYAPESAHLEDPLASIDGPDTIDMDVDLGADDIVSVAGMNDESGGSLIMCDATNDYCGARRASDPVTLTLSLPDLSPTATYVPGASVVSIADIPVSVNGPPATIGGAVIHLNPTGLVITSASTISLPTLGPSANAPITIAGQTVEYHRGSNVIQVGSVALSSNGAQVTLPSGQLVSWGSEGLKVVAATTLAISNSDQVPAPIATYVGTFSVAGKAYTYHPGGSTFAIGSTTLTVGGAPVQAGGVMYTLGPSGVVALAAPTSLPSYAAVVKIAGHTYTVLPGDKTLNLGTTTITYNGPAATVSNEYVSLGGGHIVVGSSTIALTMGTTVSRTGLSLATATSTGHTSGRTTGHTTGLTAGLTTATGAPAKAKSGASGLSSGLCLTRGLVLGMLTGLFTFLQVI